MEGEGTGEGTQTGDGTGQAQEYAWEAQLPQDLRGNPEIKGKFKTIGDYAKSNLELIPKLKEAEILKGQLENSIPKLAKDATPEQQAEYTASLRDVTSPDGYEFKGDDLSPELVGWAKKSFFDVGLNKSQAAKITEGWNQLVGGMKKAEEERNAKAMAEAETQLKAKYGDKYPEKVELAKRYWGTKAGVDFDEFVKEKGLLNDARFIGYLISHAENTGEDTSPRPTPAHGDSSKEFNATSFYEAIAVKK